MVLPTASAELAEEPNPTSPAFPARPPTTVVRESGKPEANGIRANPPEAPAGPAGPVAPVAPAAPVSPASPCSPIGPVGPMGPIGPTGPDTPAGPAGPTPPVIAAASQPPKVPEASRQTTFENVDEPVNPGNCTCWPGNTLIAGVEAAELMTTPPPGGGVMVTSSAAAENAAAIATSIRLDLKDFLIRVSIQNSELMESGCAKTGLSPPPAQPQAPGTGKNQRNQAYCNAIPHGNGSRPHGQGIDCHRAEFSRSRATCRVHPCQRPCRADHSSSIRELLRQLHLPAGKIKCSAVKHGNTPNAIDQSARAGGHGARRLDIRASKIHLPTREMKVGIRGNRHFSRCDGGTLRQQKKNQEFVQHSFARQYMEHPGPRVEMRFALMYFQIHLFV